MHGAVTSRNCTAWERGADCGFDQSRFLSAATTLWLLTCLAFLVKALMPGQAGGTPTGTSRWCLLLAALSSGMCALDAIAALGSSHAAPNNNSPRVAATYSYGTLTVLGTVFAVFALNLFIRRWTDIAAALSNLAEGPDVAAAARRPLAIIRRGHDFWALVHVPFAIGYVVGQYGKRSAGVSFDAAAVAWMVWCALSAGALATFLALARWCFVVVPMAGIQRAYNLRKAAVVSIVEQGLYCVLLIATACLYNSPQYNAVGAVQAAVFSLQLLLVWVVHLQLLFFFVVVDPKHALCNDQEFRLLIVDGSAVKAPSGVADGVHPEAATIGSPVGGASGSGTQV